MSTSAKLLSVIVCTFNRSKYLDKCLNSLVQQVDVDPHEFEILIIDNNSKDNTKEVVQKYIHDFPNISIQYVFEKTPGLSHARNRGIDEAKGQYVAFIDDDGIAHRDWIKEIISFTKRKPTIQGFGGPSYRIAEIPIPKWTPDNYGTVDLGSHEKEVTIGIIGCNMVFKKSLFDEIGKFNPNLGMKGGKMGYGEEDEIFRKMIQRNLPIMYVPQIKIDHLLETYKLSMFWRLKSKFTKVAVEIKRSTKENNRFNTSKEVAKLLSLHYFFSHKPLQQKIYTLLLACAIILGSIYGHILKIF